MDRIISKFKTVIQCKNKNSFDHLFHLFRKNESSQKDVYIFFQDRNGEIFKVKYECAHGTKIVGVKCPTNLLKESENYDLKQRIIFNPIRGIKFEPDAHENPDDVPPSTITSMNQEEDNKMKISEDDFTGNESSPPHQKTEKK